MKKFLSLALTFILLLYPMAEIAVYALPGAVAVEDCSGFMNEITLATYTPTANFSQNFVLTGNMATDIANVAYAQLGKTQSQLGYTYAWCATFVSDCARIAGIPTTIIKDATLAYPSYFGLSDSQKVSKDNIKNGDLCFWSDGHVGIVYNGQVVSGNNQSSSETVSTVKRYADQYAYAGTATYYRPNYTTKSNLTSDEIKAHMTANYQKALSNANVTSFNGYCGECVGQQLLALGINTTRIVANGNATYDTYAGMQKTSGGYAVNKYPASSHSMKQALTVLNNAPNYNYTYALFNFEKTPTSEGQLYGHTLLVYAVVDGTVYYAESFTISSMNSVYGVRSIDSFCSAYGQSGYVYDGMVWFSGNDTVTNPVYANISNGTYYITNSGYKCTW